LFFKDWKKFEPQWIRWVSVVAVVVAAIFSVNAQIKQQADGAANEKANRESIEGFNNQIAGQRKDFFTQYNNLSGQLRDLEIKDATHELHGQIDQLKAQLQNTQEALVRPLAHLTFTFPELKEPVLLDKPFKPLTETDTNLKADGTVHVHFSVINNTKVPALDGTITVQICDLCAFAGEPNGFRRLSNMKETQRLIDFQRILSGGAEWEFFNADIRPPADARQIEIGVFHRCENCELVTDPARFTVRIRRP
jgi:hypothetical protein